MLLANPYTCWEPVGPPNFVGRDRELSKIYQAVKDMRGVSVVGDGQVGKSSLLDTVRGFYREQGRSVAALSGLDSACRSIQHFVEAVTGEAASDEPDQAADVLARWAERQGRSHGAPILLVDDAEACFQRFPLRFFERLRGMLYKLVPVFASRQELDLLTQAAHGPSTVSPLENRLEIVRLGLLGTDAAEAVVRRGDGVLESQDKVVMRLWAGRHPFYLQLCGMHLWQARHSGDSRELALDTVYAQARPRLRQIWQSLAPREQDALKAALRGAPVTQRSLRLRGLVTERGRLFGHFLREWLEQETAS